MKILLVRNDNLGDLICTTPAIEALRKRYPYAQIDIVVNSYNFLAIRNNPFINTIYVYTKSKHEKSFVNKLKALGSKLAIFGKIFRTKYDVAVVFRSKYSPYAEQFSVVSMAKTRIGVKNPNGEDHFTHHVSPLENEHEVIFCYRCLEPLKVIPDGEKLFFYLEDEVVNKFKPLGINLLFHISSRKPENRLSFEKIATIFKELKKKVPVYFTSAPQDIELAKALEKETQAKFVPTKNLLELAGVIKNSKLFVTLDGGAVHLAPALGVKTIAIFGSTPIDRWYPWGYKDLVIQHPSKVAENIKTSEILKRIYENLEL
ncbi:MAG: glycosyltransferase family 9 protein [Thermodesulfobacteria bacterium]|nr:glycosyltransferase family 9 protein [Thermodesulfobacteriota bacterium]